MFREMSRVKQTLSHEECLWLLKKVKRGMLSVQGDDGYPYVLPINHWYCEDDGKLYFHSGKQGHKIDAIRSNEKASFCVMDEGTPVADAWWLQFHSVIVFGKIEILEDHEQTLEISRKLCYQFTIDKSYIQQEIKQHGAGLLVFALTPEHITGKRVMER